MIFHVIQILGFIHLSINPTVPLADPADFNRCLFLLSESPSSPLSESTPDSHPKGHISTIYNVVSAWCENPVRNAWVAPGAWRFTLTGALHILTN